MKLSIALILKGYPRLSETFVAQEIRALEENGIDILLVSLRHPTDKARHPIHEKIEAKVLYLPEYLHQEPLRCLKGILSGLFKPEFLPTLKLWLKDFQRDSTRNRVRRLGQALVLARELPPHIRHLYAHFIHTPGSVTRYTSELTAIPWSASAHAKDIWTIPQWEIREKLHHLSWLATCTKANAEYLRSLSNDPHKVELVYHGIDFRRFSRPTPQSGTKHPPTIVKLISVGRAVPKKGYFYLLDALASLPDNLQWRFTHIGDGPLLNKLKAHAVELNLQNRIKWMGSLTQDEVLELYRQSHIFVLPSQVTEDGDRDGLPNVLMEAQSQQLCCISTNISGIPELIETGVSGLLVQQKDSTALTSALEIVIRNPELREQMAKAGYERVSNEFSMDKGISTLLLRFQNTAL